eukprot:4349653-Ditylum_brightwellii.AAC.1
MEGAHLSGTATKCLVRRPFSSYGSSSIDWIAPATTVSGVIVIDIVARSSEWMLALWRELNIIFWNKGCSVLSSVYGL